jgi:hypothetical protein
MVFNTIFNNILVILCWSVLPYHHWGRRDRDCMVVGFTTTYAIIDYPH